MNLLIANRVITAVTDACNRGYFHSAVSAKRAYHPSKNKSLVLQSSKTLGALELSELEKKTYLIDREDLNIILENCTEVIKTISTHGYGEIKITDIIRVEREIQEVRHWCFDENLMIKLHLIENDLSDLKYNTLLHSAIINARTVLARGNSWNTPNSVRRTIIKLSDAISDAKSEALIEEALYINRKLEYLLHSFS